MSAPKKLVGKRIAVLAADGFEKEELFAPVAALKLAGAEVVIVALHAGRIRGMDVHQPADLLQVDKTVNQVRADDYEGLLIPGGYISPDLLRQSAHARDFVRIMNALGKPIALAPADLSEMMPLMFGMLGMSSLRSYEKVKGVAR